MTDTRPPRQLDRDNPLPLYYQLRMAILDRIASGEFGPGQAIPSERQLAEAYDVSRITVVRALNDLAREGVLERRHGQGTFVSAYPPQIQIQPTARRTVAFMAPVLTDPYLFDIVRGVERVTTSNGYRLVMMCTNEDASQEAAYVLTAPRQGFAGLLVYPIHGEPNRRVFEQALAEGGPLVFIDRYYPGLPSDCVISDDEGGGYALTRHLLEQSHRRVAFTPWYEFECTSVQGRLRGYQRALEEASLPVDDSLIWSDLYPRGADAVEETQAARLTQLLAESAATAIFAANFVVATYLLRDLSSCGLRIPEDISLVGFGLDHPSLYYPFSFTAAKQSGFEVGQASARLLLNRIEGRLNPGPQRIVVPVPVAIHGSSGPAPSVTPASLIGNT